MQIVIDITKRELKELQANPDSAMEWLKKLADSNVIIDDDERTCADVPASECMLYENCTVCPIAIRGNRR